MYGCLSNFDNNSYIQKIIQFDEIVWELKLKTKIIHEFFKNLYLFEGTNRKNWWTKKVISFFSGMEHMYMSKTHTVYWVYPSSSAHIKMKILNCKQEEQATAILAIAGYWVLWNLVKGGQLILIVQLIIIEQLLTLISALLQELTQRTRFLIGKLCVWLER